MRNAILCSVVVMVAACTPTADQSTSVPATPDSATARLAAEDLARQYSEQIVTGDAAKVGLLFTEDATTAYFGFPTTSGRANIQALYAAAFEASGKPTSSQIVVTATNAVAPGLITVLGTNAQTADSAGTMITNYWRWASAIRQDTDGQWRFAYSMAFPDSTHRK